jgi:hypothetical protein
MSFEQYVKLDDVLTAIDECRCSDCSNKAPLPCSFCQFRDVYKKVIDLPVINVASGYEGKWQHHWSKPFGCTYSVCSCCGERSPHGVEYNFCPHCGAKQKGGAE